MRAPGFTTLSPAVSCGFTAQESSAVGGLRPPIIRPFVTGVFSSGMRGAGVGGVTGWGSGSASADASTGGGSGAATGVRGSGAVACGLAAGSSRSRGSTQERISGTRPVGTSTNFLERRTTRRGSPSVMRGTLVKRRSCQEAIRASNRLFPCWLRSHSRCKQREHWAASKSWTVSPNSLHSTKKSCLEATGVAF